MLCRRVYINVCNCQYYSTAILYKRDVALIDNGGLDVLLSKHR